MGGIVETTGRKLASANSQRAKEKSELAYYRTLAFDADKQAKAVRAAGAEEEKNLLRSAAEKRRAAYQAYRAKQAQQQTSWAAAGLNSGSATVGEILQNDRLQAVLEAQKAARGLEESLAKTQQQTAEQIRQLQETSAQARSKMRGLRSGWKLGSKLFSFFTKK